jgi:hypothetical protein
MSTIKVDTVRPVTADASLTLQGDNSGTGVSGITIDSSGNATFAQTITGGTIGSGVDLSNHYASTSEVQGTHTTGTITSGTTSLTVVSGSGISNGDYVVGEGIAPGTTVSSGGGTTSITLSANAAATLSSDPVAFYTANKALSPGLVAGQLCRAWVNFNGQGTVAIRATYNVSSITDNGLGQATITFTTAMPDANYNAVAMGTQVSGTGNNGTVMISDVVAPTSSALRIITSVSNTTTDLLYVNIAIFR